MVAFLLAVLPSAGVLFLFWIGIRSLVQADRRERLAQARIEAAEAAARRSAGHDGTTSGRSAGSTGPGA
jgi:threonine/homoserine/homoserine lactone efflux protein